MVDEQNAAKCGGRHPYVIEAMRGLRGNRAVSGWSLVGVIILLWMFGWVPNVLNLIARGRLKFTFTSEYYEDSIPAVLSVRVIYALLVVGLAIVYWIDSRPTTQRSWKALIPALLPAALLIFVSNIANGVYPTQPQVFIYAAVCVALWMHGSDRIPLVTIGWLVIVTATAALALGLLGVGVLTDADGVSTEKALVFPSLLSGMYSYNNSLGMSLVAALPFVLVIKPRRLAAIGAALAAIAILWSGSRASLMALAAAGVVGTALMLTRANPRIRQWLGTLTLAAASIVIIALPFIERHNPSSFSSRGRLWDVALDMWMRSPVIGLGRGVFEPDGELSRTINLVVAHGHNFLVTMLVVGGLIGAAAAAILVIQVSVASVRALDLSLVPYLLVLIMLVLGVLETPSNFFPFERPNTTSYVTWVIFALGFWATDVNGFRAAFRRTPDPHESSPADA
ncbi:O-antigen ligase family protein [Propionicimonas sp.]|uniref:O-antigen ligase family protein n=1 Tax=Propionicimonas sp. TaxID=1955623 RepID=UPI0039E60403